MTRFELSDTQKSATAAAFTTQQQTTTTARKMIAHLMQVANSARHTVVMDVRRAFIARAEINLGPFRRTRDDEQPASKRAEWVVFVVVDRAAGDVPR
jgi:hypothetical protein